MRNLLTRAASVAMALLTMAGSAGCETEMEGGRKMVVDDIPVEPEAWKPFTVEGKFDHLYADVAMPDINEFIFERASFHTYLRSTGSNAEGGDIAVQELEGIAKSKQRFVDGAWVYYTETISCRYSVGTVRFELRRSDFFDRPPTERMLFRTVILY